MRHRLFLALFFGACSSSSTTPTIDAPLSMIDAAAGAPDAPASGTPDAKAGAIDAKPGADSPTPVPDAPPAETCIPQCFFDAVAPLVTSCPQSGTCTRYFDINTLTTTTCWSNGTKIVTMLAGSTITTTAKSASGTCYTMTTTAPTQTSAKLVWSNSSGTQVVELDVPNTSMSNLVSYICGTSAPIQVDLNSAVCQAQAPDAGPGPDGGAGCTMSASCTP